MDAFGDSYCGIYCGACSVLRHGETGRGDAFVACCAGVPAQELACGGCKSDRVYPGCRVCKFRDCAVERRVEHCVDCADYPCRLFEQWRSAAWFLPHVREAAPNLEAVRRQGADAWLAAQAKRWSCPGCGARFSWYARSCTECGRSLSAEAHPMKGLRKLVCRLVLPSVYRKGKQREG